MVNMHVLLKIRVDNFENDLNDYNITISVPVHVHYLACDNVCVLVGRHHILHVCTHSTVYISVRGIPGLLA